MATILGNIVQSNTDINNEVIASDMLAASAASANAYLNAALTSPTPELRAMYSSNLHQIVSGYCSLSDLSVNRGWEKPYDPPVQQLSETLSKSKGLINQQ